MTDLEMLILEGNKGLTKIHDRIFLDCMNMETYEQALNYLKTLKRKYGPTGSFNNTPEECYNSAICSVIDDIARQLHSEANESKIRRN